MDKITENKILNALQTINIKLDVVQAEVEKIPEIQKEVAKIPEIQKEVAKIPEIQKEVAKIPKMQKEIAKISEMQQQIIELQKEARSISRSVAVIEYEHGDKLKALFDAFTTHTEKNEEQDRKINLCEHRLENHETQLYFLKSKVEGL